MDLVRSKVSKINNKCKMGQISGFFARQKKFCSWNMDHQDILMGSILEVLDLVNCHQKVDFIEVTLAKT